MNIEEVKATIRQGNESVKDARRTLETARGGLADATALALASVHDSAHEHVKAGHHALKEAAHEIELTFRWLKSSTDGADSYLGGLG